MQPSPSTQRDQSAGYLISRLHWSFTRYLVQEFRDEGLNRAQVAVLADAFILAEAPQDALSAMQGTDNAATTRALQALEEKGLVFRKEDPANKRRKLVSVTEKARAIEPAFFSKLGSLSESLFHGFTPEERSQLIVFLHKMMFNIQAALDKE